MPRNNTSPIQVQKLMEFFNPDEINALVSDLKTVFEMAAFETVNEIQSQEKEALSSQYRLISLLESLQ